MTELELYKFIKDNDPEIHWHGDRLLVFLSYYELKEFQDLLREKTSVFDEDSVEVNMRDTYFVIDLVPICEWNDIDPKNIYSEEE